jgi:2-oxoglutarate ferredoxin oxidoreductase subunit alpha
MSKRTVIKIAGEQGMGIDSTGLIVMKTLKNMGFWVYGEREFNSLIKGGKSSIQINFSSQKVRGISSQIDIGLAVDREGVIECLETVKEGGVLIHGFERWQKAVKDLPKIAKQKNLKVVLVPAREIALQMGGNIIMTNVVLLGFLWKVLGLELSSLQKQIAKQFIKKPQFIEINQECARGGFEYNPSTEENLHGLIELDTHDLSTNGEEKILIDGNTAIALGAVQAGVRAYYAYPMSPSSSILAYLSKIAPKTKMLVKQLEDEISVAQHTLGSSYAGTRSMCATSGGGFDLMTETVSLAGMIEVPFVCVIAQRPGPATGLPTWTSQADLNLAIYSGHGEYAKIVLACSDPETCFDLTQHAHNLAEKYQLPVIILTEANIAMSYTSIAKFKENQIPIQRHISIEEKEIANLESNLPVKFDKQTVESQNFEILEKLNPDDRYKITESGISHRWIPGSSKTISFTNGDEHLEDGSLTEDSEPSKKMLQKRLKKLDAILLDLPDPEIYQFEKSQNPDTKIIKVKNLKKYKVGIIGFGSTKNPVLDALDNLQNSEIAYLHLDYIYPLKKQKVVDFFNSCQKTLLTEANQLGQLGQLIKLETGLDFTDKLLKWDGRSFFVEEIIDKVNQLLA